MKGQISFVEFIVSFTIFCIFVIYLFLTLTSYMPAYLREIRNERVRSEAFLISEILVNDPGEPADWGLTEYYDWWNNEWHYRRKLILDNSAHDEDLIDFPVLVKLSTSWDDPFDYNKAKGDGTDLRFIDIDGTELKYHIEKWDASGDSFIWVKVPEILARSDAGYIWMYYGNDEAPDVQNEEETYDSKFAAVWHFGESSGLIEDSTSNENNGNNMGATYGADGKIGKALDFDGGNDHVMVSDKPSLEMNGGKITIEAWIKPDDWGESERGHIVSKRESTHSGYEYYLNNFGGGLETLCIVISAVNPRCSTTPPNRAVTLNEWNYVVVTYDGANVRHYTDGKLMNTVGEGGLLSNSEILYIGENDQRQRAFDGVMDEVRISNIARSDSWINASNMTMTDQFITYGLEEAYVSPDLPDIDRLGLSDIENKTNLLSLSKVNTLNLMCQGNGYYDVKRLIGTEQDFSIFLTTKPGGNLLLSCYPPITAYRGVNVTVKRFVMVGVLDKKPGEMIVQMW